MSEAATTSCMTIERFRKLAEGVNGLPTDRIVELLDRHKFWDDDILEAVQLNWKRDYVRKMLGRVKRDDGQRLFINIAVDNGRGRRVRVYKNREQMTVEEFRVAVEYYQKQGLKGIATAKALVRDCKALHGVQLKFAFTGR